MALLKAPKTTSPLKKRHAAGSLPGLRELAGDSSLALRVAAVIAFVASGFYPVGLIYLAAALFMEPERH